METDALIREKIDTLEDDTFIEMEDVPSKDEVKSFDSAVLYPEGQSDASERIWNWNYWQSHFDVSTETILRRLKKAMHPKESAEFFLNEKPDFYTPLWISITLVFCLSLSCTLYPILGGQTHADPTVTTQVLETESKLYKIVTAGSTILFLMSVVPISFYCLLSNAGSSVSFAETLSIYGYSFIYFIPAALLCSIPSNILRWIALFAAMGCSLALLSRNYWGEVKVFEGWKRYAVFGLSLGGHFLLVIVAELYVYG